MGKTLYRIAMVNKDTNEKTFWTGTKFGEQIKESITAEKKQIEAEAVKAKKFAEEKFGCPCPHDIIVEDTEGKAWYIPDSVNLDG